MDSKTFNRKHAPHVVSTKILERNSIWQNYTNFAEMLSTSEMLVNEKFVKSTVVVEISKSDP